MQLIKWYYVLLAIGFAHSFGEEEMRFTNGTGDMGRYIVQQALKLGAKAVSTNDLPRINGDWKFSEDQYGVVLQLAPKKFYEVDAFLRKAFGTPAHEPDETTDGGKLGWYAAKSTGIAVQFGYDSQRTEVILLRPQKSSEVYKRAQGLAKTKDKELYGQLAAESYAAEVAVKAAVEKGYKGELGGVATDLGESGWMVGVFEKSKGPIDGHLVTILLDKKQRVVVIQPSSAAKQ